ncbi:MAG TPA: preprotein translocase subunit SecG [Blastocatellia bacterium]|nr:preprotein translocase subunit SecG [Blastocatellia bacterium]
MILAYIFKVIFVITSILLVLAILLQSGKGGDVASAFGGAGSQSAFGPRGPQKPLEKATAILAGIFMVIALLFSMPGFGVSTVASGSAGASATPAPVATPVATPATTASPAVSPQASATPSSSPAATPAAKK